MDAAEILNYFCLFCICTVWNMMLLANIVCIEHINMIVFRRAKFQRRIRRPKWVCANDIFCDSISTRLALDHMAMIFLLWYFNACSWIRSIEFELSSSLLLCEPLITLSAAMQLITAEWLCLHWKHVAMMPLRWSSIVRINSVGLIYDVFATLGYWGRIWWCMNKQETYVNDADFK